MCSCKFSCKTRQTDALTNSGLDENGFGLIGVDAVSCSANGLGSKRVLLPSLQSVDGESTRANKCLKSVGFYIDPSSDFHKLMVASIAPGVCDRLIVDGVPVLLADLAVIQVVAKDFVFVSWLLPLELHRGVRVSDSQDGTRRSRRCWLDSGERGEVR